MAVFFKDVEAQALALPECERNALVARLLDSLEPEMHDSPQAIAKARDEEIARHVADCESSRTRSIPAEVVQAEIQVLLRHHAKA